MPEKRIAFWTCPLCEAGCGLAIEVQDGTVTQIRGDHADVFNGIPVTVDAMAQASTGSLAR